MNKTQTAKVSKKISALIKSAEDGAGNSASDLGDRYREGNGVLQDYAEALKWYRIGADLGNPYAQNNLGSMLLNGMGCAVNEVEAAQWFERSALQGNAIAQFNLGLRYLHHSGVTQDDGQAFAWIARSATQGNVEAIGELGTLFLQGRGTAPDLLQAAQLHLVAAQEGDACSHGNLGDYRDRLIALALAGNREAAFALSRMADWGLGQERSPEWCWAWIHWGQEHCAPLLPGESRTPDLNEETTAAFEFFQASMDEDVRQRGEDWLQALVATGQKMAKKGAADGLV